MGSSDWSWCWLFSTSISTKLPFSRLASTCARKHLVHPCPHALTHCPSGLTRLQGAFSRSLRCRYKAKHQSIATSAFFSHCSLFLSFSLSLSLGAFFGGKASLIFLLGRATSSRRWSQGQASCRGGTSQTQSTRHCGPSPVEVHMPKQNPYTPEN